MEPKNKPFCSQNLILIAWLHFTIDMINTDDKKKKKSELNLKNSASLPMFPRREVSRTQMMEWEWCEGNALR